LDNTAVRVAFPKFYCASYHLGQYIFLNVPSVSLLEWHPYTLSSGPDELTCEITVKGLGDHTKALIKAAEDRNNLWIRVDGPYGKWPFNISRYRAVVLVAGGVGATPSIAALRHIYHVNRETQTVDPFLQNVFFIWSCKSMADFKWFQKTIEKIFTRGEDPTFPRFHPYIHVTSKDEAVFDPRLRPGRPNMTAIFDEIEQEVKYKDDRLRVGVVACGPAAMVNETWDECTNRTKDKHRFDFHHETFEF